MSKEQETPHRITALVWDSYARTLSEAGRRLGADIRVFTRVMLNDSPDVLDTIRRTAKGSDVVIVHSMGSELPAAIRDMLLGLPEEVSVLSMGRDPMSFSYTTGPKEVAVRCCEYLNVNGKENCEACIRYIQREILGMDVSVPDVRNIPWQGIVDTDGNRFDSIGEYIAAHPPIGGAPWIGIVTSRASWVNDNCDIEYDLVKRLRDKGCNTVMIYASPRTSLKDDMLGLADAVMEYMRLNGKFLPSAIVKCTVLQFGRPLKYREETGGDLLSTIDVPVFQPLVPSSMSRRTFMESPGLKRDVSFGITFQEFEGTIEPILIGFSREDNQSKSRRTPIPERMERLVGRILRRIALRDKPNSEKKVAFILNNYPCAGADANVGEAHNLDTMASLKNILKRLKDEGYAVDVPESGKAIMDEILSRKALSDFRWTDSLEIERCDGVLYRMTPSEYREWFDTLSDEVKSDVVRIWGEPPGEAMVRNGDILITGIRLGNVLLMVQPKRGCYGPKCDGTVCRMLHDPVCPPTHQYLATYHWLDSVWNADAIVHTGMHGNMEYLPGKGSGLTSDCYPDVCIGTMPHMYIFDSGAPPAAAMAKRRGYGTLVNHLPPAIERVKAYGPLDELRRVLEQYETARNDPLRSGEYRNILIKAAEAAGIDESELDERKGLQEIFKLCTEEYSRLSNTHVQIGLHVIGESLDDHSRASIITSILSAGDDSICAELAASEGQDYRRMQTEPDSVDETTGIPNSILAERIYDRCLGAVEDTIAGRDNPFSAETAARIGAVDRDISGSDEISSFVHALEGGFVRPGPSGLLTSGRSEILPTGRNPYIIDPRGVPTETSWKTGTILAEKTVERYQKDAGSVPETISMFWMSSDLMNEGGEMMSQILRLIGVRPLWAPDGQVKGFEIIPLEELGRPRIDVTIRISGILMESFPACVDLVDSAFIAVSALDEPFESNYVKKHTLESIAEGIPDDDATARIFSSAPGSATSGVPLAVYANAWKTERDLADIYVATNGYAYGNDRNGKPLHGQFMNALSSTSMTYSKMGTDEYDILGSPGFFGNIGGMSIASKIITGKEVRSYFGDTRVPGSAGVHTLKDEVRRVTRARLLNPQWIEGMKSSGYQGAAEMMKRAGRVYGFGATTDAVDDRVFDEIAETFINNPEMQAFFRENNPYAAEEIGRRLLEAAERGIWDADPEILERLKRNYLSLEGDLEGIAGDGEYQGSSTEISSYGDVDAWKESNGALMDSVRKMMDRKTQ